MGLLKNLKLKEALLINFANLTDDEKETVRNWRNTGGIRKWMYTDHIISRKEHADFIERIKKDSHNLYWLVKVKKDYIGVVYLNNVDLRNKNAYLGVYSNPDYKRKGAGQILLASLKKIAFDMLKLHTLKLEVLTDNHRAIKFYQKWGFRNEGRLDNFVLKDGIYKDVMIMGLKI